MNAIRLFLKMPWWLFAIAALAVFGAAEAYWYFANQVNDERRAALAGPAPEAVNLNVFDWGKDRALVNEVVITGLIDWNSTAQLVRWKDNEITAERAAYFLLGEAGSTEVQAIMLLGVAEGEKFENIERQFWVGGTDDNPVYQLNGTVSKRDGFGEQATRAIADAGLTVSDDVFFFEPFLDGREAGLAPLQNLGEGRLILHGLGGLILLVAVVKLVIARRKTQKSPEPSEHIAPLMEVKSPKFPSAAPLSEEERAELAPADDAPKPSVLAKAKESLSGKDRVDIVAKGLGAVVCLAIVSAPSQLIFLVPLGVVLCAYAYVPAVNAWAKGIFAKSEPKTKLPDTDPFERFNAQVKGTLD